MESQARPNVQLWSHLPAALKRTSLHILRLKTHLARLFAFPFVEEALEDLDALLALVDHLNELVLQLVDVRVLEKVLADACRGVDRRAAEGLLSANIVVFRLVIVGSVLHPVALLLVRRALPLEVRLNVAV